MQLSTQTWGLLTYYVSTLITHFPISSNCLITILNFKTLKLAKNNNNYKCYFLQRALFHTNICDIYYCILTLPAVHGFYLHCSKTRIMSPHGLVVYIIQPCRYYIFTVLTTTLGFPNKHFCNSRIGTDPLSSGPKLKTALVHATTGFYKRAMLIRKK